MTKVFSIVKNQILQYHLFLLRITLGAGGGGLIGWLCTIFIADISQDIAKRVQLMGVFIWILLINQCIDKTYETLPLKRKIENVCFALFLGIFAITILISASIYLM